MPHGDPREPDATRHGSFAMDPEPTLRQLARHLVATQQEMAALARHAHTQRELAADNVHLKTQLAVWDDFQRQWFARRLPSLIAAMRLTLEVYNTFGSGMIRLDDPIEAGIWNNKYFVWERELSPAVDRSR
jgi:GNAT superfamily N-acetyltransferase